MSRGYDAVAVCSYGRAATVAKDTLSTMLRGGVPGEAISVYTPQVDDYRDAIDAAARDPENPAGLEQVRVIEVPVGLHNAQNAVLDWAAPGDRIVFADDDVRGVDRLAVIRGKATLRPQDDLSGLFRAAFERAEYEHATLWGLYPVHNAFYMKHELRVGLWFCIGQLFGVRVTEDRQYGSEAAAKKGDYERTLMHFERDGAVMRMDWLAADCAPMRTAAGGNATPERAEDERRAVAELQRRWPGLVHAKPDRMGYPEIALRAPRA